MFLIYIQSYIRLHAYTLGFVLKFRPKPIRKIVSSLPPDAANSHSGEIATSVGWGVTEDGKPSKYLRQVSSIKIR
jgi:hypothetical protein